MVKQIKLEHLTDCLRFTSEAVSNSDIDIQVINDAPKLVKLLSRGSYCAYGTTVYVPTQHLALYASKSDSLKALATAKLLPWIMLIKNSSKVSYWRLFTTVISWKTLSFYFLYEYFYLKSSDSPYTDTIYAGFTSTRKSILGRHIPPEKTVSYLNSVLIKSKPSL